jgi:hypothetical protein
MSRVNRHVPHGSLETVKELGRRDLPGEINGKRSKFFR